MSFKPYVLAAIAATLDLVVAAMLVAVGAQAFGYYMAAVAVGGYVLALVLWRRSR